jgi:hypothetical protein
MARARVTLAGAVALAVLMVAVPAGAGSSAAKPSDDGGPAAHWTAARRAAATPRDLVVDGRGLGYLKRADGSLQPHGHDIPQLSAVPEGASRPSPAAKPGGGSDTSPPSVSDRTPADGAIIGATQTFSATVTDPSGVKSVSVVIVYPNGQTQTVAATASGSVWSATITGFTNGGWGWRVVATDNVRRPNSTTTSTFDFIVDTGGSGGGGGDAVVNEHWTDGGTVQRAAGRIYFEMPANSRQTRWDGYVCSGTVATDAATDRSVIITAAHCVYDDVHKAFARDVLFIPDQDGTTGAGTDLDCTNDPIGCWTPSFGVVDADWANRTFPDNIPWDYAFYVVDDAGAHSGAAADSEALDTAAGALTVQLSAPTSGAVAHALGYSYSEDPAFMYCAEALATESDYDDWWLGQCGLSGGASGGPWLQPVTGGDGPIISLNSWGYTNQPGMAGSRLVGSSAGCLFDLAKIQPFATVTERGVTAC